MSNAHSTPMSDEVLMRHLTWVGGIVLGVAIAIAWIANTVA